MTREEAIKDGWVETQSYYAGLKIWKKG